MLFKLMVWLISQRVNSLIKKDAKFRYAIREKKVILQFALQNGKPVRYLEFVRGRFTSRSGWHDRSQMAGSHGHLGERVLILSFKSAMTGLNLLMKSPKDSSVMLDAIRNKDLILDGDFTVFMWFGWLGEQL